jgi:hypothetical protein
MAPDTPATDQNKASHTTSAKRLQVPRACERCKRLRRGCSLARPCQRCLDAGQEHQCLVDVETRPGVSRIALENVQNSTVHQQLMDLLPGPFLDFCISRFFDRLYPTIPILTSEYISRIRIESPPENGLQPSCILLAMCAQVLLQTEEPEDLSSLGVIAQSSLGYSHILLERAGSIWQSLPRNAPVTIELCLFTFFLYACEAVLSHHSRAFRYLRDTATFLLLYQGDGADEMERLVSGRLFWVLLISERSHAIRYRRPITLHITEETPSPNVLDPSLLGFLSLAELFRPLDTSFIALHNNEALSLGPSPAYINDVEGKVNSALGSGFGLYDTQKANLRVTQLWLRLVIWKLRLRLGYLVEESYQHSITFRYPIEIAKELMLSTQDLPTSSFTIHGGGMMEKLFDIASALVDVLARVPVIPTSPSGTLVDLPVNGLSYLRTLIRNSPGGNNTYDDLLEKHIQQTIPSLATRPPIAG